MPRPPLGLGTWGNISTKKDGHAWVARCRVRDMDGEVRQASGSGKTKAAAEAALKFPLSKRFIAATDGDVKPETTLDQLKDIWLDKVREEGNLEDSSIEVYEWAAEYIGKKLGKVRVREVTVPMCRKFVNTARGESLSKGRLLRTVLGMMLGLATDDGAIPSNPVRSLPKMPRAKKAVRALDVPTVNVLRRRITVWQQRPGFGQRDSQLLAIVDIHLATGARIGEVLALRWSDVDFEKNIVTISGTITKGKAKRDGGPGFYRKQKTKTGSGRSHAGLGDGGSVRAGRELER